MSELDKENNTVKCLTTLNTEILIRFYFANLDLEIIEGNETRLYTINFPFDVTGNEKDINPRVFLDGATIEKNGKKLESEYSDFGFARELQLDDTQTSNIDVWIPEDTDIGDENFGLRNRVEIEDFLLGLGTPLVLSQVCRKIVELLSFNVEDISKCEEICISYTENGKSEECVLIKYGKIHFYTISDDVDIIYEEGKETSFTITSARKNMLQVNFNETLNHMKKEISEFRKILGKE